MDWILLNPLPPVPFLICYLLQPFKVPSWAWGVITRYMAQRLQLVMLMLTSVQDDGLWESFEKHNCTFSMLIGICLFTRGGSRTASTYCGELEMWTKPLQIATASSENQPNPNWIRILLDHYNLTRQQILEVDVGKTVECRNCRWNYRGKSIAGDGWEPSKGG